jgi:hypothetical protein
MLLQIAVAGFQTTKGGYSFFEDDETAVYTADFSKLYCLLG